MSAKQDMPVDYDYARRVMVAHQEDLLNRPNVVGCGIGFRQIQGKRTQELAIVVLVNQKIPVAGLDPDAVIPQELDGVPVDVQQVGTLTAEV